jgi:hypothetical protein
MADELLTMRAEAAAWRHAVKLDRERVVAGRQPAWTLVEREELYQAGRRAREETPMGDELTPAEAADAARRIIGQVEALQRWVEDQGIPYGPTLADIAYALQQVRRGIERHGDYAGGITVGDPTPVKPLGGGR